MTVAGIAGALFMYIYIYMDLVRCWVHTPHLISVFIARAKGWTIWLLGLIAGACGAVALAPAKEPIVDLHHGQSVVSWIFPCPVKLMILLGVFTFLFPFPVKNRAASDRGFRRILWTHGQSASPHALGHCSSVKPRLLHAWPKGINCRREVYSIKTIND